MNNRENRTVAVVGKHGNVEEIIVLFVMPYNDWAYPWVSISDVKLGETFSVNFPGLQLFLIWGRNS